MAVPSYQKDGPTHSYLRFTTRFRLRLPLGSRMGCAPIFVIVIAIPIHPFTNVIAIA